MVRMACWNAKIDPTIDHIGTIVSISILLRMHKHLRKRGVAEVTKSLYTPLYITRTTDLLLFWMKNAISIIIKSELNNYRCEEFVLAHNYDKIKTWAEGTHPSDVASVMSEPRWREDLLRRMHMMDT